MESDKEIQVTIDIPESRDFAFIRISSKRGLTKLRLSSILQSIAQQVLDDTETEVPVVEETK